MPAPSPASIAGPLTDRLNALRVRRGDRGGLELDQIRFKAQGLRNSDRAAFLAVSGMIAALEQKPDDLLALSAELEENFPERVGCQLNVLRSFIALRLQSEARDLALRIVDRVEGPEDANVLAGCLLHAGAVESARDIAARFTKVYGHLDLQPAEELRGTLDIAESFLTAGFNDRDLASFLDCARVSFAKQGWATPTLEFTAPCCDEIERPVAIARFEVAIDDVEALLEVEEGLMDDLIAANDHIFRSAAVVVAVMPHASSSNE